MSASRDRREPAFEFVSAPFAMLLIGVAATALLSAGVAFAPRAVAWGWLVGFLVWSSAPIGAIALALIHVTTGGRWGLAAAPTLRLGALCAVLLPLFFAPLLPGLGTLYPWANGAATAPDVAHDFLNRPVFAAVGFVALLGWAAIGAIIAIGRLGLLGASLALVFHGFAVSLVAVQWMLSIDPKVSDSAFGAEIAVQQILMALAAVAVIQPRRAVDVADGDIGGLMLASALGAAYLGLMTFIVKWYGDQPVDAAWYLARAHGVGGGLLVGALLFGSVAPVVGCAWERVRASPAAMRAIGLSAILGVFLHDLWFAGPAAPALAAPAALLAVAAMAGLSIGAATVLERRLSSRNPRLQAHESRR